MPDSNQFFIWIDILGTASFAISGVLAARNRKLDMMGVLIIAFTTAIGGGTLRDMLTGDLPVTWIRTIRPTVVILIASFIAMFFNMRRRFILLPLLVFDSLGLGLFTLLGIQKGMENNLHPVICIMLGTVTGDLPVTWIRTIRPTVVILIASFIAMFFNMRRRFILLPLLVFDSLGLGLFTLLGIQKGMENNLHPVICIMLGTVTACFGGVIRDIALNTIPLIFRKEIYASACLAGGIVYFILLKTGFDLYWLNVSCILLIFIIRIIAVKYKLRLPVIDRTDVDGPASDAY